jgi:predicted AAA+ superfamily ATPase
MLSRELNLLKLLDKKSYFLFGPRQTGKTSLIKAQLPEATYINLLESNTFIEYSAKPSLLRERLSKQKIVVIDEIQKLPQLLDEVQLLIDERKTTFLLTGSSARKLRRGGVNLLGGRARSRFLLPLTSHELGAQFNLSMALNNGLIPSIYFSDDPNEDLKSYIGDYLSQEIAAESFVRNITGYSRFLNVAGFYHAQQINFEQLALEAQISPSTIRNYFQILQDTLIGTTLLPWKEGGKLREVSTPKFYLFDNGAARKLQGRPSIVNKTPEYGFAMEAFIHHELRAFIEYRKREGTLHFWRTRDKKEVDFIFNGEIAIEVKSKASLTPKDLKGLLALDAEYSLKKLIVVTEEREPRQIGKITALPWQNFLAQLWDGELTK